jgi:putative transposase
MHGGKCRADIESSLDIDANHYYRIKQRYFAGGLPQALEEYPRSGQPAKVTARLEAQITSLACSDAPAGHARWTLSLINEKLIELAYVETISNETIRQVLKKATANPGNNRCGASVP